MTDALTARLAAAGCVAAEEEAAVLRQHSALGAGLEHLVRRREQGEPLEWIVGWAPFLGHRLALTPGVYVPRPQTELVALAAIERLPARGVAIDLATGCGAIAVALSAAVPTASVLATELNPLAAACAATNGVRVLTGDLDKPLPADLAGGVDVLTANVPYVPTGALGLLPRDVRDHEPLLALDGGPDGLDLLRRVLEAGRRWLRAGGWLVVELGGDQAGPVLGLADALGYDECEVLCDEEGDPRGVAARWPGVNGS